jgi:DNA-binding LacI/PurR family transcriptional regulator
VSKASDIADTILKRVRTGTYQVKIPGERSLASEFHADFKTANRAIGLLVDQGVLERRRGQGTFVKPLDQRRDTILSLCFFKFSDLGRDPVFTRFFAGMNSAVTSHRLRLHVTTLQDVVGEATLDPAQRAERFVHDALAVNPDGIIYLGNVDIPVIERLRANRPLIAVAECPPSLAVDSVRRDIRAGTAAAVRRFAKAGHTRIALATYRHDDASFDLAEKERGYLEAIEELDLPPRILRLAGLADEQIVHQLLALNPRPTALVGSESTLGLAVVRHGPGLGLRIPEDLAVAAFDDGDIGSFTRPQMSSIHAFGEELAQLAVERMIGRLDGRITGRINDVLPCPCIER